MMIIGILRRKSIGHLVAPRRDGERYVVYRSCLGADSAGGDAVLGFQGWITN